jgi:hypothetical protein
MQAMFTEVSSGDVEAVRQRLANDPDSIALVATGAPKKYAGQSPLMLALRTGQFEIAELLLDHGADVGFIDTASARPVLHDAITAAVLRAEPSLREQRGPVDTTETSYALLRRMIEAGANVDAVDSRGNSSLHRAVADAEQVLPSRDPEEAVDPVFAQNLTRVFGLLLASGADPDRVEPQLGNSVSDFYGEDLVGRFLG